MITYGELIGHVRPFFLSRGGDELAGNDRMMFYANCALQDVHNNDSATFTYKTETLVGVQNGSYKKFTASFNIRKIQECIGTLSSGSTVKLTPTLFITRETERDWVKFETGTNEILTHTDFISVEMVYIKEYKWATCPESLADEVQVPHRYIPAVCKLMYDWASPVNLMSGETAQVDFFSHAMTRLKMLSDSDSLTDVYDIKSAY